VGNILRRHDIAPAPKRSQTTTWKEFIRRHMVALDSIKAALRGRCDPDGGAGMVLCTQTRSGLLDDSHVGKP
jgi:hypothetical protein